MTININLKQMKQIKNLLLATVLFIGIGSVAQAQVKIAHIDSEKLIASMPVSELQKKLQLYAKTADKELQQKQMDLLKPILDKAQKTIQAVAKAQGIKYVFDSSPGKGLIVFDGEDLLPAVKAKLGINN